MAKLLFKLHNVPEDEANAVRQLLAEQDLPTYESHAGFWGLGVAAIWLIDTSQWERARSLIDAYQAELLAEQRRAHAEQVAAGKVPTFRDKFLEQPIKFIAALVAITLVLALSTVPIWGLLNG